MIDTLATLLITIFAVLPGIIGNRLYELIAGSHWKEDFWNRIVRIIGFSFAGLVLYILLGVQYLNLQMPLYLLPETYLSPSFSQFQIIQTVYVLLLIFLASTLAAIASALLVRTYNKLAPLSVSYTWSELLRSYTPNHWVVVNLKSGASYAGILEMADVDVSAEERDIIIKEPAQYDKDLDNYLSSSYQYLYLPGSSVSSIAIIYNSSTDARISPVNQALFPKRTNSGGHSDER